MILDIVYEYAKDTIAIGNILSTDKCVLCMAKGTRIHTFR